MQKRREQSKSGHNAPHPWAHCAGAVMLLRQSAARHPPSLPSLQFSRADTGKSASDATTRQRMQLPRSAVLNTVPSVVCLRLATCIVPARFQRGPAATPAPNSALTPIWIRPPLPRCVAAGSAVFSRRRLQCVLRRCKPLTLLCVCMLIAQRSLLASLRLERSARSDCTYQSAANRLSAATYAERLIVPRRADCASSPSLRRHAGRS
jgi:hypothetical protein